MVLNPEIVAHLREFHIGTTTFYAYGLLISLSALFSSSLFLKFNRSEKLKDTITPGLVITLGFSSIIFGRVFSVLSEIGYYASNLSEITDLRSGGMSIFGVMAGFVIGYYLYDIISSKEKTSLWEFLDAIVPYFALTQSIARWGNFINQELYGPPTDAPWKMYISPEYRLDGYSHFEHFHPSFLYESILDLMLFFVLLSISSKVSKLRNTGLTTGTYAMMYGLIRLVVNRYRLGDTPFLGGVGLTDLWAFFIVVGGGILIYFSIHGKEKGTLPSKSRR